MGKVPDYLPLPERFTSLVKVLADRFQRHWCDDAQLLQDDASDAYYDTSFYLRQRAPDEMEAVLATLDQNALDQFHHSFSDDRSLNLVQFAEAIIQTGTYDADRVLAFVGGVVDLYFEVRRSQAERANVDSPLSICWNQLMNHLIESPDIAMYDSQVTTGPDNNKGRGNSANLPQMHRSTIVDCAKHPGKNIEKVYWLPYLGDVYTVEGTESVYSWSPEGRIDQHRNALCPQLEEEFYDETGKALFTVLALAWDQELQDLVGLLSNHMIVVWRLRSREKGQFQQKRELKIDAHKTLAPPTALGAEKEPIWKLFLKIVDSKDNKGNSATTRVKSVPITAQQERNQERQMMREKRDERQAAEVSTMLDIWWNANMTMYATTDPKGKLYFWDLREVEAAIMEGTFSPVHVLTEHQATVTALIEIGRYKFTTCSLDHTVLLWDNRNLSTYEMKIDDHSSSVLSQAYLPLFSSLVSVGCEKRIFVWSIDSTAYRGVRAKLSAHQANLRQVSAGQRVFFTLDEACMVILWDGATLANLQTVSCHTLQPKQLLVMPILGRLCLVGRRLNFYEGNEPFAHLVGMVPTKEQLARRKAEQEAQGNIKERAKPRWCGFSASRGEMLSVTEAEVKIHSRSNGSQSQVIFNAPEGESITYFIAMDSLSIGMLATNKGGIHFLKSRSGFPLKVYQGRKAEQLKTRAQPRQQGAGGDTDTIDGPRSRFSSEATIGQPESGQFTPGNTRPRSQSGGRANEVPSPGAASNAAGRKPLSDHLDAHLNDGGGDGSRPSRGRQGSGGDGKAGAEPMRVTTPGPTAQDDEGTDSRVRRFKEQMSNAPSAEEVQNGLATKVLCLLACQEQHRVFAGTADGQVLSFLLDGDNQEFPCVRWMKASPDDVSPITCMQHSLNGTNTVNGEGGLLVVGTQEGVAHVYGLINLRYAGSVCIPRILPDADTTQGAVALRHIMMFTARASADLPCTMLTVDDRSRMRLWGMRIHEHSGKMVALRLVLDGDQPMPLRLEPLEGTALGLATMEDLKKPDVVYVKKKASPEATIAKEEIAAGIEQDVPRKKDAGTPYDTRTKDCKIHCFTTVEGRLALPTFERFRWSEEASRRPPPLPELEPPGDDSDRGMDVGPFLTQSPLNTVGSPIRERMESSMSPKSRSKAMTLSGSGREVAKQEAESSDSEIEASDVVCARMPFRPKTPPLPLENETPPFTYADGKHVVFLADANGWIRCLDMAASIAAAVEDDSPIPVRLEEVDLLAHLQEKKRRLQRTLTSRTNRGGPRGSRGSISVRMDDEPSNAVLQGPVPPTRREAWKVTGAWRASQDALLSLVATTSPPGLVSVDASKEVKVWSTFGDLWAHFSLLPKDGQFMRATVWPPPQSISAQTALMEVAKDVTDRLGLYTRRRPRLKERPQEQRQHRDQRAIKAATAPAGRLGTMKKVSVVSATAKATTGNSGRAEAGDRASAARSRAPSAQDGDAADPGSDGDMLTRGSGANGADAELTLKPTSPELSAEPSEAAVSPTSAAEDAEDAAACTSASPEVKPRKRRFTSAQMNEMIRGHAFSGGFVNYKKFQSSRSDPRLGATLRRPIPRGMPTAREFQDRRREFYGRSEEAFGVKLHTKREAEHWENIRGGLGGRSASEGALVRFAEACVDDSTSAVFQELHVEVASTSRDRMRRPSFVARLDIGGVSIDPSNPCSATAQAVQKIIALPPVVATHGTRPESATASPGDVGGVGRARSSLRNAGLMTITK